jgi:hypothetical protein
VVLALPLALAGPTRPSTPESPDDLDSGTFTLYLNGARIGDERFVIHEEGSGSAGPVYRAYAELNLKLDGRTMRISVALEALGSLCRPRRYEAEINGSEATTIVGQLIRDRIRLDVRSPAGDEMKEFLIRGATAIIDPLIAHQYFFVAKILGDEASADLSIIVPRERNQLKASIVDQGEEVVQVGEREVRVRHIALTTDNGITHHVWLDGDRVMQVEVPDEGFRAVRSDAIDPSTR